MTAPLKRVLVAHAKDTFLSKPTFLQIGSSMATKEMNQILKAPVRNQMHS